RAAARLRPPAAGGDRPGRGRAAQRTDACPAVGRFVRAQGGDGGGGGLRRGLAGLPGHEGIAPVTSAPPPRPGWRPPALARTPRASHDGVVNGGGRDMFDRFSRSWELVKASAGVLRSDKALMLFPVLSGIATLAVLA